MPRQPWRLAYRPGHFAPGMIGTTGKPPSTSRAPRSAIKLGSVRDLVVKLRLPELLVVDIDDDPKQPEPLIFGHALKIISLGVNDVFAGSFGGGFESRLFLLLGGFH